MFTLTLIALLFVIASIASIVLSALGPSLGIATASADGVPGLGAMTFYGRGYGHGVGMSQYGARGRALHQVEALQEKAMRALKKRDQSRADRLRRTRDALMPGGAFQERGLGLVNLLARQGLAVVEDVGQRINPFARGHQVIYL